MPPAWSISTLFVLALVVLRPASAWSQPPPDAEPTPPPEERPGTFRIGAFYLTPYFRIHSIGVDTNVLYTATDRQADFLANGGPGLELVFPLGRTSRVYARADGSYLFFARTESQRRWNYSAAGGVELEGAKTRVVLDHTVARTFSRPSFEVDQRVIQDTVNTRLNLKRALFWRLSVTLGGNRDDTQVENVDYLGTDLGKNLSRIEYRARAGLAYAITVKTSLVGEVEREWDRFEQDELRDAKSIRFVGGFRTDSTALIAGQALVGQRRYRPENFPASEQRLTVADIDATLNISPRTRVGVSFNRDLNYSAFAPSDAPTLRNETYGARLEKTLTTRIDLRLFGRRIFYQGQGPVTLVLPDGSTQTDERDDKIWEVGADLGYRFRPKFRVGAVVTYSERESTFAYFGVDGLLVGMSVNYNP